MSGTIRTRVLSDGKTKRYDVIFRDGTGKQRWKTFKKWKDADHELTAQAEKPRPGTYQRVNAKPMKEVLAQWLEDELEVRVKEGLMTPGTAATYRSIVKVHLTPAFGEHRSDQLRGAALEWRKTMAAAVDDGSIAAKTRNHILVLLRQIVTWSRKQGYVSDDPLEGVKRLKLDRREADFLERGDVIHLLNAVRDRPDENAVIHAALFAGLRRGEIFGLKWGDIDIEKSRVHIRRSVRQRVIGRPKTENSRRAVDLLPPNVLKAFEQYKSAGPPSSDRDFIFRQDSGSPIAPEAWYASAFKKIRARAGLRRSIGLHSLRHTYASLLIGEGENIKCVSTQLGHSSIQMTADVYAHVLKENSASAMEKFDRLIDGINREADVAASGLRLA
ncbi:MAG: tyrosine-type recombinase/integrase [Acidobacteriota bacterium]|nr:tyrosine-type recombinase/integrase [Acidobacteriota bacterium]